MAGKYGSHAIETFKCANGCGATVKVTVRNIRGKQIIVKNELPYTVCLACRQKQAAALAEMAS